ncbi:MAG: hypothetical protein COA58_00255 [Bacteroidetes bacterium]|nr:MAG: hypothetical protein COA58_00255 [Bacteroidota bacterium]
MLFSSTIRKKVFCLVIFTLFSVHFANAGHNYTYSANGSDYTITFSYTNGFSSYCNCENHTTYIYGRKTSHTSGAWFYFTVPGGATSGSALDVLGPSGTRTYYTTWHYSGRKKVVTCLTDKSCGTKVSSNNSVTAGTASIKPPTNVQASDAVSDNYIDITWDKGSDIPDANLKYKIYTGSTLIATVAGNVRSYRHTGITPGTTTTYRVRTTTTDWGGHESYLYASAASDVGSTFTLGLNASDYAYTGRTVLSWNDVSTQAEEIEISRIDQGVTTQIGVVSKYSRSFSDYDGIPGYLYQYKVIPVNTGATFIPDYDNGSKKVNGQIKGKVVSNQNAGVSGVVVNISASVNVNGTNQIETYQTTTDASGYYEIRDIFYYKIAKYTVTPSKSGHAFDPPSLDRTLDIDNPKASGVDFVDTTVFTIKGNIAFPIRGSASTAACGIQGVQILLDNNEIVQTDVNGNFAFVVQDEGTYNIKPVYKHHNFNVPSVDLNILADVLNLQFYDTEQDTLKIVAQGGCESSIGNSVKVRIRSIKDPACFDTTINTDANGFYELPLSSREYKIEVIDLSPVNSNIINQIGFKSVVVDLTVRDSIELFDTTYTIDTTDAYTVTLPNGDVKTYDAVYDTTASTIASTMFDQIGEAKFIYHAPLEIAINWDDAAEKLVCMPKFGGGNELVPEMEKGGYYGITIDVTENNMTCPIKEGRLDIYDYISDRDKEVQTLQIVDGRAEYTLQAADPQIAGGGMHPNQKLFYLIANVGFLDPVPNEKWVLVTGSQARDKTFTTRSAGIPFVVLHDPPGDQSYSYVEKGSVITHFLNTESVFGGSGGLKTEIKIGAAIKTPFSETKLGIAIDADIRGGRDNNDKESTITTFTFKERFTTSQAEALTGYPGDVFVGAAFNMLYSLADAIEHNGTCDISRDTILAIDPIGFATTFIYTEGFLNEVLLPNLKEIKRLAPPDSAIALQVDIDNWEKMLEDNAKNRDSLAVKLPGAAGNISISTGAVYDNEYTDDDETTASYESKQFFTSEVWIAAHGVNEAGAWTDTRIGVVATVNYSLTTDSGTTTSNSKTVGYHIEDNDRNDYHSIDILKDVANGVPAFRLVSGATSCPHEPNSQRRYLAEIDIYPPERSNVPSDGVATFTASVINNSQSDETQTYAIRVLPETNLDGAIIKIGGQIINNGAAYFTIPPRQLMQVSVTVERGPLATEYKGLQILISAQCEWDDLYDLVSSDVVTFDVNFQSECSEVDIYRPVENWVMNKSDGDFLDLAFANYNANDPNLESLILEYRKEGKGWQEAIEVPKDSLLQKFYDVKINTKLWSDGIYQIRAMANCRAAISQTTYSDPVPGKIDRSPVGLFGIPFPSDGILNIGDEITVEFDKFIDKSQSYLPGKIALQRDDTREYIAITYAIIDGKLIISPKSSTILDALEGVKLNAVVSQIEDQSGNVLEDPITWSFVVNRSPVYWSPNSVDYSVERGLTGAFTATLINEGPTLGSYTLTKYPAWLIPGSLTGTVTQLGGTSDINFNLASNLNPGLYYDTIVATSGAYQLNLYVKVEVLTKAPRWVSNGFDPSPFANSMNTIVQFSTTDLDAPLSTDIRDVIGVFINDSLRGKGYIQYVPQLRKYMAFVSIYNSTINQDTMEFRIWDANPGVHYLALEKKVFKENSLLGQIQSPFVLHPNGIFQTLNLAKNWNWFSLYVQNPNPSVDNLLEKLTKDSMTVVKTRDAYSIYGNSWSGELDSLEPGVGYMIHVSEPDTVEIYGQIPGKIETSVDGNNSWTWIGNADLIGSSLKTKLKDLSAESGDIIKSQTDFSVYDDAASDWLGTLGYVEPGGGYKIQTKVPGTLVSANKFKTLPQWNFIYLDQEFNTSITCELINGGNSISESHYLIGAFINDKCIGIAQPIYNKDLDKFIMYLTAFGNDVAQGENIAFKLYDTDLDEEVFITYDPLTFTGDKITGTLNEAFEIELPTLGIQNLLKQGIRMSCYPNPFNTSFNIQITLNQQASSEVSLIDVYGRTVKHIQTGKLQAGSNELSVSTQDLSKGIYYCIATINGQLIQQMIIKQ